MKPTGPARIIKHGSDFTAVDRFGVVIERHKDAAEEPLIQFAGR